MNCNKCGNEIKDDYFFVKGNEKEVYCYDCANKKAHCGSDRKKKQVVFIEKTRGDRWVFCNSCHKLMQIKKKHNICDFCYLDFNKRGID